MSEVGGGCVVFFVKKTKKSRACSLFQMKQSEWLCFESLKGFLLNG